MNEDSLATELLKELKNSSKRWFIAFLVTLVLWFATIGVFLWYISLPVDEISYDVDQEADRNSFNDLQIVGGNYGSETESASPEETQSSQK